MTTETNTKIVAKFLSENSDIGMAELIEATGLTKTQVENTLEHLMARGVVMSIPKRYELTAKGLEELQRPKGFPLPPGMGKRSRRRAAEREVELDANAVVGLARANRHALDMAWVVA